MERLTIDEVIAHCKRHTERMENHSGRMQLEETPIGNSNIMKQYWEHRQVAEWLEQLKDYKDAEEQGLILRLPFKIGQKVYYIYESLIGESKSFMIGSMVYSYSCLDFPRNYFETKEEAEQALKRMECELLKGEEE